MESPIFLTKLQKQGIIKDSFGGASMMMQITEENKAAVLEKLKQGRVDDAMISGENFVETIMKKMLEMGIIGEFGHIVPDKRASNASIPLHLLWTPAITAKMKVKTSMSDIPYAIEDAALLAQLGWNLRSDWAGGVGNGLVDFVKGAPGGGRATALTFFGVKIPLQAVFFEEKIHR